MSETFSYVVDCYAHFSDGDVRERLTWLLDTELGKALVQAVQERSNDAGDFTVRSAMQTHRTSQTRDATVVHEEHVLELCCLLLRLLLQVNCLGPPLTELRPTEKALEERREIAQHILPEGTVTPSEWTSIQNFWRAFPLGRPDDRVGESRSDVVTDIQLAAWAAELAIDGDILCDSIRGVGLLWACLQLFCALHDPAAADLKRHPFSHPPNTFALRVVYWRLAMFWQQCLSSGHACPSPTLSKIFVGDCLTFFERSLVSYGCHVLQWQSQVIRPQLQLFPSVLESTKDAEWRTSTLTTDIASTWYRDLPPPIAVRLLVQLSLGLSYCSHTAAALNVLECAGALIGVTLAFDSVLGIRREQQLKPVAQLVLRRKKKLSVSSAQHASTSAPGTSVKNVSLSELDPVTDILDQARLDASTADEDELRGRLTPLEYLLVLGQCYAIFRSSVTYDLLTLEQLRALVERCLADVKPPPEWLIYSCCLWFRSKTEFYRTKTRDRSVLQLQALVDQYWEREPSLSECMLYSFSVAYPLRGSAALELGRLMGQCGAFMTAYEMFKEMWMWEDAVENLIAAGRRAMALDLLEQRVALYPTPRLLCCLGDVKQDPDAYEKAWELSNQRYARAKRSLGRYYVSKGDISKAIENFRIALTINPMQENTWFTLGCCEMRTKEYDAALESFTNVVTLSKEGNGEAWANLAAVHTQKGSWSLAMVCIREAVKLCNENWRVWDSFTKISIKVCRLADAIEGIQALLRLGKKADIPDWMFGFVSDMGVDAAHKGDTTDATRALQFLENVLSDFISNRPVVYDCCARIAAACDDYQKEFSLRLKQLRTTVATLPVGFDTATCERDFAPSLVRTLEDVILAFRRWQRDEQTTPDQCHTQAGELVSLLANLKERLNLLSFPCSTVYQQLDEAVRYLETC